MSNDDPSDRTIIRPRGNLPGGFLDGASIRQRRAAKLPDFELHLVIPLKCKKAINLADDGPSCQAR